MGTKDCRAAIQQWVDTPGTIYHGCKWLIPLKESTRMRKSKNSQKQVVREFNNMREVGNCWLETFIRVTETPNGLLVESYTDQEHDELSDKLYGAGWSERINGIVANKNQI